MIYDTTYGPGPLDGKDVRVVEFGTGDIAVDLEKYGNSIHLHQLKVPGVVGSVAAENTKVDHAGYMDDVPAVILKFNERASLEALRVAVDYVLEKWKE